MTFVKKVSKVSKSDRLISSIACLTVQVLKVIKNKSKNRVVYACCENTVLLDRMFH